MKFKLLCAALLAFSAVAQAQTGSRIGITGPSTGTSGDSAGAAGTTAPRSNTSETSVGTSGATAPAIPNRSSGLCDTLIGEERLKCQREQAATGSAGAGSTGAASGTTGGAGAAGGSTPGTGSGR
jgi:hypothetical protein